MASNKEELRTKLDQVIWNIERARLKVSEHHIVRIIAVGKYTEVDDLRTLYELGQRAYGENQVQQLKSRTEELDDVPIEWHMIGSLQKNKINQLIDLCPTLFQALDSIELAQALNQRLEAKGETMDCLLQINSACEKTKSGVDPDDALDVYQAIIDNCTSIKLRGVMTIGAHTNDKSKIRDSFETTHKIFESLHDKGADICSMGMSGDYELAIECGSNMVRVGSALFK
jgi:pyridoxal phosphate enzyme (YggS family)